MKKIKLFKTLLVLIVLITSINSLWAYNETYIVGDLLHNYVDNKWTTTDYPIGTYNDSGTGFTYMYIANGNYFKFRINGKPAGAEDSWDMTTDGTSATFYKYGDKDPAAARYTGYSGVVKFNCTSTTSDNPVINLTRPWIWIRHNWGNDGWSNQHMTDNEDGTYTYIGSYSGTQRAHVGPDADTKTSPDNSFKDFNNNITLIGSPVEDDLCLFTFNSYWYRSSTQNSTSYIGTLTIAKVYTVTFNTKGVGNNFTKYVACTSENDQTLTQPDELQDGLIGWYTDEDCTIAYNFSSVVTNNLTLYAKWTDMTNSVTISANNASAGSLKIDNVSQSWGTYTIGVTNKITVTPAPGYYFTGWSDMPAGMHKVVDETTYTGGDAYFHADGTGKTITANFARHYAYIVGCFHVQNEARNSWVNTFDSSDSPWWDSSNKIEFDYDDTKHVFYRRTYATLDELSEQLGNEGHKSDPWFFVKTSSSTGLVSLTDERTYQHGSDASFTAAGESNGLLLKEYQSSGSVKFSSDDESGYVVIYFNESKIWYEVEPVTFKVDAASTSWNTATNWSPNVVPTSDLDVMIESPVVVDADAVAKSVKIHNDGTNSHKGKLTIGAGKKLIVEEDIQKTTDGSTKIATTSDVLHIATGVVDEKHVNGALIWKTLNSTPGAAQVDFYSISGGSKGSKNSVNQFIGTPFTGATNNWVYNYDNSWLYGVDYSGASPAWKLLGGGDTMDPFEGYCLIYNGAAGNTYEMSGTLVSNADLTGDNKIALQYKDATKAHNENVLANSWTAPIKITAFNAASDFTNAEATIYIFNAGSPEDVASAGAAAIDATSAGQWITIPVNSGSWGGSTPTIQVIPSMQSFSVYSTSAGASLAMDYSTLVYDPAVAGTATIVPNRAPKLEKEEAPVVTHLFVKSDSGYGDMLWMLERSDFDEGFDNGWDGRKIAGESVAPQLYAVSTDGEMAVDAVKNLDGTVIGFKAGSKDNVYTFTFDYDADETPLYLFDTDAEEGTYTRVLEGNSYTFTTTDKDAHNRFVLRKSPTIATGVENVGSSANAEKAMKFIKDNQLYIIRGNHMYNAEGSMVK